jgi:hypothetical protein
VYTRLRALMAAGMPVEPDGGDYVEHGNENTDTDAGLTFGAPVSPTLTERENARRSPFTCLRALAAGAPVEPDGIYGVDNGNGFDSTGLILGAAVSPTRTERENRPSGSAPNVGTARRSSSRPPLPPTRPVERTLPKKNPRQAKKKTADESVPTTPRVPITRKRKAQSSGNEEEDLKKIKIDVAVGPDSTEMIAIKRMLIYLEETSSDVVLVRTFHKIVEDSEKRHAIGQAKYKHLPGAIFERLVEQVGGAVFGPIYKASRHFEHKRVKEMFPQESAPGSLEYEDLTASGIGMPNLLQVAVGYGFHLARMSMLNHGHDDTCENIQELMESGAETALSMKDDERFLFWKYMIESPSVKDHLEGNF